MDREIDTLMIIDKDTAFRILWTPHNNTEILTNMEMAELEEIQKKKVCIREHVGKT